MTSRLSVLATNVDCCLTKNRSGYEPKSHSCYIAERASVLTALSHKGMVRLS